MKRMKTLISALLLVAAASAQAEMLRWMIGNSTNGGTNAITFNYAIVYATDGQTTIEVGDEYYGAEDLSSITTTGPNETELGDNFSWSNYSFYVELMAWDGANETTVGVSESATYDALVSHGAIVPSGMGIPPTSQLWMPTTAAPEPTSGLLLLVGTLFLGLKRPSRSSELRRTSGVC